MSNKIVDNAAALRGEGHFEEAIRLVESSLSQLDEISRQPALLNALYAAKEGGLTDKAKELAALIAEEDPDLPSIQEFL